MNTEQCKRISKTLSYILRHAPDSVGLVLEEAGWVPVDRLLEAYGQHHRPLPRNVLDEVVATNDKRRFEFSADGTRIRARQGHSVEVDLAYEPAPPPAMLYHGTASRSLDSILKQGLLKGHRHHVHMSTDRQTMLAVGMRHGQPVLLEIDAARMAADGHVFFVTGNQVWLTAHVPPQYLRVVE